PCCSRWACLRTWPIAPHPPTRRAPRRKACRAFLPDLLRHPRPRSARPPGRCRPPCPLQPQSLPADLAPRLGPARTSRLTAESSVVSQAGAEQAGAPAPQPGVVCAASGGVPDVRGLCGRTEILVLSGELILRVARA